MKNGRKVRKKEKDKTNPARKNMWEIIEFFLPWVAIALSIGTLAYTVRHDVVLENIESYRDTLNYVLEVKENERQGGDIADPHDLPDKSISVKSYKGGVDCVEIIYYGVDGYTAILDCKLSDKIDHEEYSATDVYPQYKDVSKPIYMLLDSSNKVESDGKSWYTRLYILIQGYDGDSYLELVVLEYPIKENKILEPNIRTYSEAKILYAKGKNQGFIPEYDYTSLCIFEKVKEDLKSIYD